MRRHYGASLANDLLDVLSRTEPVTSVRLNPLHGAQLPVVSVPWCPWGAYIDERPSFVADPLLHAGAYYVQEASSMFLWYAISRIDLPAAPVVLDLCAAPGGKSTLCLSCLPPQAMLVCNEAIASRTAALTENICKWGHANVVVTDRPTDVFARMGETFDVVICDVPCSGEGMFRKSADAVGQWCLAKVVRSQRLQRKIVADAWACLHPGGWLIYSTCTFNPLENEDNVEWILRELGGESIDLQPPADWHLLPAQHSDAHGYHFLPCRIRGEGFFLSVVRKPGEHICGRKTRVQKSLSSPVRSGMQGLSLDTERMEGYVLVTDARSRLCAYPTVHLPLLDILSHGGIRPLQAGTPVAEKRGRDKWRPAQPLAHSPLCDRHSLPQVALDRAAALAYLHGQTLTLLPETPRGYVLATYEGHPLGFLNNVGPHANNLYPAPWRIQKAL